MEDRKYFVYIHEFPNGKVYIGQTYQTVDDRWKNGNGYKSQSLLNNAIQKYGWDNIIHDILEFDLTQEEANELEKYWISYYESTNRDFGYNISIGGSSANGYRHTEETRKKFSEQRKGERNSFYGKHHSQQTKLLIGKLNKGRNCGSNSPRAKAIYKIDLNTGEIISTYGSITEASKSETMRKHISDCCLGKRRSCEGYKWQYVDEPHEFVSNWSSLSSVKQIDLQNGEVIKIYKTMRDAVDELGVSQSAVKKCCDGKRKSTGGFGWEYNKGDDLSNEETKH